MSAMVPTGTQTPIATFAPVPSPPSLLLVGDVADEVLAAEFVVLEIAVDEAVLNVVGMVSAASELTEEVDMVVAAPELTEEVGMVVAASDLAEEVGDELVELSLATTTGPAESSLSPCLMLSMPLCPTFSPLSNIHMHEPVSDLACRHRVSPSVARDFEILPVTF